MFADSPRAAELRDRTARNAANALFRREVAGQGGCLADVFAQQPAQVLRPSRYAARQRRSGKEKRQRSTVSSALTLQEYCELDGVEPMTSPERKKPSTCLPPSRSVNVWDDGGDHAPLDCQRYPTPIT